VPEYDFIILVFCYPYCLVTVFVTRVVLSLVILAHDRVYGVSVLDLVIVEEQMVTQYFVVDCDRGGIIFVVAVHTAILSMILRTTFRGNTRE